MWADVLEPFSRPGTRSAIDPASRSMPSSRATARAQPSAGPSNGSAPAAVSSGVPSTAPFSGSTTSSAPAAAAARVSRSAVARLRSRSVVDVSCTAAARTLGLLPVRLTGQSTPVRQDTAPMGLPERMPLIRGGRPLKRWTYAGAYGPDVMLCAASARIGVIPVAWWAVWDRANQRLSEGRRGVTVTRDRVVVKDVFELVLGDGQPV